jgi:hypothetical protein
MKTYWMEIMGSFTATIVVDAENEDDAWKKAGDRCREMSNQRSLDDIETLEAEVSALDWVEEGEEADDGVPA